MESPVKSTASVRLLIADGQPRGRQSLEALLTALRWNPANGIAVSIEIVGEANNGHSALEQVRALRPDVVVLDLPTHEPSAPGGLGDGAEADGLRTIQAIKQCWPAIRVVVLTLYATDRSAILLSGADAFLLKGCSTGELLAAVMSGAVHS